MPEERSLIAKIKPTIDPEDLKTFTASIQSAVQAGFIGSNGQQSADLGAGSTATTTGSSKTQEDIIAAGTAKGQEAARKKAQEETAGGGGGGTGGIGDGYSALNSKWKDMDAMGKAKSALAALSRDTSGMDEGAAKDQANAMKAISGGIQTGINTTVGLMKGTFGLVEDIYKRMKAASPLLQTISNLFDLAVTLFFLPLGNKLAEVMLPAVLDLVDAVVDMWDKFEGKSLSEMLEIAFNYGVGLFARYFEDIGTSLEEQGGKLASIGKLLSTMGAFIADTLPDLLNFVITIATYFMKYFPEIISILAGFFATKIALDIATMYVIAASNSMAGWAGAGVAVAGLATAGITYGAIQGFANGGHVSHVPGTGGQLVTVAENEGETIIPDSKVGSFGTTNIQYTINGYTDSELEDIIDRTVSKQISRSRIRAGI